eukprot:108116-Chlamydomonas_euryale.AAC.1
MRRSASRSSSSSSTTSGRRQPLATAACRCQLRPATASDCCNCQQLPLSAHGDCQLLPVVIRSGPSGPWSAALSSAAWLVALV